MKGQKDRLREGDAMDFRENDASRAPLRHGSIAALFSRRSPSTYHVAFAMVVLAILGISWIHPGAVIARADTFYPYHPFDLLRKTIFGFNALYSPYGQYDNDVVLAGWLTLLGALQVFFGPSSAQIALAVLFLFSGWLMLYLIARRIGTSCTASASAAWLYTFNPLTQAEFGTSVIINMAFFAFAPALVYGIMRAAEEPRTRPFVRFAICVGSSTLLTILGMNPPLIALFIATPFLFLPVIASQNRDRSDFYRWLGVTGFFASASALWWLVPAVTGFLVNRAETTLDPTSYSFFLHRAGLFNQLRFDPWWVVEFLGGFADYEKNVGTYLAGFVLISCAAVGLAFCERRNRRTVTYLMALALVMIFLAKGLHGPLESLNAALYRFPGMFLFREPTTKFPLIGTLATALTAAFGIDVILRVSKRFAKLVVLPIVLAISCSSALLLINGTLFNDWTDTRPSPRVAITSDYDAARDWLAVHAINGSTLLLPGHASYQATYRWGYQAIDIVPSLEFPTRISFVGTRPGYVSDARALATDRILERMIYAGDKHVVTMMRRFGVARIIYRSDVDQGSGLPLSGSLVRRLLGAPTVTFGALAIFSIPGGDIVDGWTGAVVSHFDHSPNVEDSVALTLGRDLPRIAESESSPLPLFALDRIRLPSAPKDMKLVKLPMIEAVPSRTRENQLRLSMEDVSGSGQPVRFVAANPAKQDVTADVELELFASGDSTFALSIDGRPDTYTRVVAVRGSQESRRVTFPSVTFVPRASVLRLQRFDGLHATVQPTNLHESYIYRSRGFAFGRMFSTTSLTYTGRTFFAAIHRPISDGAMLTLSGSSGDPDLFDQLLLSVSHEGRTMVCPLLVHPDILEYAVAQPIVDCLAANGESFTRVDDIYLDAIGLSVADASRERHVAVTYASDPQSLYPNFATGKSPGIEEAFSCLRAPCVPRQKIVTVVRRDDLGATYRIDDPDVRLVRTLDAFDPYEVGFANASVARHVAIDGWRSGWIVAGKSDLRTFHLMNVAQIVLGIASLFLITGLAAKCVR